MTSLEAAARYAAFTWYVECRTACGTRVIAEANRFAGQNWQAFIPVADEGWGRLLLAMTKRRRRSRTPRPEAVAC